MDVVLSFFAVVAAGGAVLFLFLRRDRPPAPGSRPQDRAPRLGGTRRR